MKGRIFFLTFLLVLLTSCCVQNIYYAQTQREVNIYLDNRFLEVVENGIVLIKAYIAIGKDATPTPLGNFRVLEKLENPEWIPNGKARIPSGDPNNPLGSRWIRFYEDYGIHGTIWPSSIGTKASGGCIRLSEKDVHEVYELVGIGAPVNVLQKKNNHI